MGSPEKPLIRRRRGIALATVLMLLVVLVAIPAALFGVVRSLSQAERNRAQARQAQYLAQAGMNHALGLLNDVLPGLTSADLLLGADGTIGGGDNGILTGHDGLTSANEIPSTGVLLPNGGGRYYVRIIDDEAAAPSDVLSGARIGGAIWADGGTNDPNYTTLPFDADNSLLMQCMGVTFDGARSVVNVRIQRAPSPGITMGGKIRIEQKVDLRGACGSMHANGPIDAKAKKDWPVKDIPTATLWSSSDTVPDFFLYSTARQQPLRPMPAISSMSTLCASPTANVVVFNAMIEDDKKTADINLDDVTKYPDGTLLCIYGSSKMKCDAKCTVNGTKDVAGSPRRLSIIATGSLEVEIKGAALWVPADSRGFTILAGGDLKLFGDRSLRVANAGAIYCGSQLTIDVDVTTNGQIICADRPNPEKGVTPTGDSVPFRKKDGKYTGDIIKDSKITKKTDITFDCSGALANKLKSAAWYPAIAN